MDLALNYNFKIKKMKKLFIIILMITTTISCDDFEGWNIDTKKPAEVKPDFLLTSAQKNLFLRMTSNSVNYNIFKFFAQHWTATTYTDEANYDLRQRDVSGTFYVYHYRDILNDLQEAIRIIDEDPELTASEKDAHKGILEMVMVYSFHVLVDTYGDVPYSEALGGKDFLLPKYDDDKAIYDDLFNKIDAAISKLSAASNAFGTADMVYNGDTSQWIKFANTLKLRMALRIADADAGMAQTKANEAINGGIFDSAADNFNYPFGSTPNANPLWVALVESGRSDIIVSETFTDIINPLNDPRAPVYMRDNYSPYKGGPYGENNAFASYTHLGDVFHTPDLEGVLMSYEESLFMMAEAVERGFVAGDAAMYYNDAITASIEYWTGSDAGAAAYLAQPSVAYATAGANWKEKIGVQKWIALYAKGFEAWSSWRMLDYPAMVRPPVSDLPVPRRYLYGNDDPQINGPNYEAAAEAMGGDELDSRVFWDITGQGN